MTGYCCCKPTACPAFVISLGLFQQKSNNYRPNQQNPRSTVQNKIKPIHGLHSDGAAHDPPDFAQKVWLGQKRSKPQREACR